MSRLLTSSRRWTGFGRLASLALAAGLLSACSEVADDPLPPVGPAAKVHPTGWLLEYSEQFHGEAIRAADWDMSSCQTCHGADYAGGFVEVSCNTCHARTPESCNTCHGTGGVSAGPPEDLSGNTSPSALGVGAHQAHLSSGIVAEIHCSDCHAFAGFDDPAHIDGDGRAEVTFGERARLDGFEPTYDPATGTCANTYCHGGGTVGLNPAVVFNDVSDTAGDCGSCHAMPPGPETGHILSDVTRCAGCHGNVVELLADGTYQFVDPALHINGETDTF